MLKAYILKLQKKDMNNGAYPFFYLRGPRFSGRRNPLLQNSREVLGQGIGMF